MSARPTLALLALWPFAVNAQQPIPQSPPPPLPSLRTTVVVLGNGVPVAAGESARPVLAIDTQQHPLAFHDITSYLRTDASTDIQQRAPSGILSDISIRGASFEQTLVLLNGFRINDSETSHFNLDLPVPTPAITNIDILHGAGSTLYGSDAIGGVADVLTTPPTATTLRLNLGGGSFGTTHESTFGSLASRRISQVLAADHELSTGFAPDRDFRSESASSETRFDTPLGATDLLFAANDRSYGADQFYGHYNSWERTKSWFAAATQPLFTHTTAAAAYRRHSDIFLLRRNQPLGYKNQHIDDGFQASLRDHRSPTSRLSVFTGIEELTDSIHSTNLGNHARNRTAIYAQAEGRIPSRASLSAGLREEVFSGGRTVWSPSAAASLWLPHSLKLRASAGHGFRIPTFLDLYYKDPATLGNPNLQPESAWNFDTGLDWYPTPNLATTLTVFHSRQHNTIDYTRAASTQPWQATNLASMQFTGIEAAADLRPRRTQQLRASWTLLLASQSAPNNLQSKYVFNYPTHNAHIEYTWTPHPSLLLQTRLNITQRYQRTAYPTWDTAIARETGRLRPYLQLSNLSNTTYEEIPGVRMPPRTLTAGLELNLTRASH